jgi:hypothetical protein
MFSSPKAPDHIWVPHTIYFQWVPGSFPRVKRPELEADHSPLPKAEVKNERNFISVSVIAPMTSIRTALLFMSVLHVVSTQRKNLG